MSTKKCGVPSMSLGSCDKPRGHKGEMHASAGDGFYAGCGLCRKPLIAGEWHRPPEGVFSYVCEGCNQHDSGS